MPQLCRVCQHPERERIELALVNGQNLSRTSELFRVSWDSLKHHKESCLPEALAKAKAEADQGHGIDLHQQLKAANSLAWYVAKQAKDAGDGELALKALDRVLKQLDLVAELAEMLDRRPVVNILLAPEWLAVREVLLAALRPYCEARAVVAAALLTLEAPHARD